MGSNKPIVKVTLNQSDVTLTPKGTQYIVKYNGTNVYVGKSLVTFDGDKAIVPKWALDKNADNTHQTQQSAEPKTYIKKAPQPIDEVAGWKAAITKLDGEFDVASAISKKQEQAESLGLEMSELNAIKSVAKDLGITEPAEPEKPKTLNEKVDDLIDLVKNLSNYVRNMNVVAQVVNPIVDKALPVNAQPAPSSVSVIGEIEKEIDGENEFKTKNKKKT